MPAVFVTNHVLAGATIGVLLRRHPVGAFAAGVGSHLLMDACPHWGMVRGYPSAEERFLHIARSDGCAGLAVMGAGMILAGGQRAPVLAAMVGAALPDIDKPCQLFFGFDPFPRWFQRLHSRIQRESPDRFRRELVVGAGLATLAAVMFRRQ
jgi:hypothetical protein